MRVGSAHAAMRVMPSTETTKVAVTSAIQAPPWPWMPNLSQRSDRSRGARYLSRANP